jgi:flagellar basal-body rod modification protein FlgD
LSSSLNLDFSTYLKILTTQLKNQDPTNATDPNQFTQELVQMAQVQQQITTNTDLESLTKATSTNSLATGIGYVGNYVQASSSSGEFPVQNGISEFGYTLANKANAASISIQNSSGTTVATINGGTAAGGNYVTWNGKDSSGNQLPDGTYSFTVNATDASGNAIASSDPVALFKVTSVQSNSNGSLQLLAGSLSLPTTDVTDVFSSASVPTATAGTAVSSAS